VGLFVRRATTPAGLERQAYVDSRQIGSKATPTRIAHDDILRRSIFASAALPVVFDPVRIPRDDGSGFDEYLDGGIADNVPIDIAQKVAAYIDVVAVDPPNDPDAQVQAASALSIVESVFGVMQARINLLATRLAYSEGLAVQNGVSPAAFNYDGYELTISQVRPASTLPGKRFDFSDRAALGEMFEIGRRDGKHGWQKLDPNEVFG
jgi:predicted patatin/cPLA2 family phospholipase